MAITMTGIPAASAETNTKVHASTFGVNATGTVTFWIRDATEAAALKLIPEFNATHKNLKIVMHVTSPNDDTSQLATAIRAGDPPDLVGLNDIDVPEFSHEGALMNLTQYVNALPYKSELSPGHLALAPNRQSVLRGALSLRPVGPLVQQAPVQRGAHRQPAHDVCSNRL